MNINKLKSVKALTNNKETNWYRMEVSEEAADIYIFDEISFFGITADQFVKELNSIKSKKIKVHINSPGGGVFDGVAIFNALKNHKIPVETYIDGLAGSIASIIALAGSKVFMAENAFYAIHNPLILVYDNAEGLRKYADKLDKIAESLIKTYTGKTGKSEEQIKSWLAAETWFTAEEAKEAGFIDEITGKIEAQDNIDLSMFDNVPERIAALIKPKNTETKQLRESMRMRLELESA